MEQNQRLHEARKLRHGRKMRMMTLRAERESGQLSQEEYFKRTNALRTEIDARLQAL